jgi:hypothetical protein
MDARTDRSCGTSAADIRRTSATRTRKPQPHGPIQAHPSPRVGESRAVHARSLTREALNVEQRLAGGRDSEDGAPSIASHNRRTP